MSEPILTEEAKRDLEAGIETIRARTPTDQEKRDLALAAMFEVQLKKAQGFELSRQGVKLQGWVAVLAFAIVAAVLVWKLDIPDCIRAWKCQPAEVQNEH